MSEAAEVKSLEEMEKSLAAMQRFIPTLKETLAKVEERNAIAYKKHVKYMVERRQKDDTYRQQMNRASAECQNRRYHEDADYRERVKERAREAARKKRARKGGAEGTSSEHSVGSIGNNQANVIDSLP